MIWAIEILIGWCIVGPWVWKRIEPRLDRWLGKP